MTMQEVLASGHCPVCLAGPFVVPAMHVARVHGIDRFALREMIGVTRGSSICDPDYSEDRREHARARAVLVPPPAKVPGLVHTMSTEGLRRQQMNGQRTVANLSARQLQAGRRRGGAVRGRQLHDQRASPCKCRNDVTTSSEGPVA